MIRYIFPTKHYPKWKHPLIAIFCIAALILGTTGCSQLSEEAKRNICPPNADIFKTPISEINNYNCKEDLQELIIHDITKFTQAEEDSSRKLGFMYFLIGLGYVSRECYLSHEWLGFLIT